jgi:hypothetical protein
MKTCGGVEVKRHASLTSEFNGGEWSASRSSRFTPGKVADTRRIGGRVGSRTGPDAVVKREISVGN